MRDIDYAFFSQMSYLNWENLNKKNIEENYKKELKIYLKDIYN